MYTPSTTTYYDSRNVTTGSRIALVIGNNAYRYTTNLRNAVADARSMSQVLTERGFQVVYREDADRVSMHKALDEFLRKLSTETVGVVFYAGHGVQINSANYLLPVDLQAEDESDIVRDGLNLGEMLDKMAIKHTKFSLAVIDACRNNPFVAQANGRAIGSLRGLAPATSNAQGIMVVYSAGANQTAIDRLNEVDNNPNGLFTREFVRVLREPGLPVQDVVNKVKQSVIAQAKSVKHEQTPAIYDQSTGEFIFTAGVRQDRVDPTQVQDLTNQLAIAKQEAERAKADADRLRREKAVLVTESKTPQITQPLTAITPIVTPAVSVSRLPFEPEMVSIPAGCFQMVSSETESGSKEATGGSLPGLKGGAGGERDSDQRQHRVCVEAFAMGKYEVTQGEWQAVMGNNPSFFSNCGERCPVEEVSWNDVQDYIIKLNAKTGRNYRLPTEAEWEYAARAGTSTRFSFGNDDSDLGTYAWFVGNSGNKTHPVGEKHPNPWGLYDMHGNVWEWTCSEYTNTYDGNETTCKNRANSSLVIRGGSWNYDPLWLRSANRNFIEPSYRYFFLGFRLIQD